MSNKSGKPSPQLLSTVIRTLENLHEVNGSHVRGITSWIRDNTDLKPSTTLTTQIKRALRHGEINGIIEKNANRYRLKTASILPPNSNEQENITPENKDLIKTTNPKNRADDDEPEDRRRRGRRRSRSRSRRRRGRGRRRRSRGRRRRGRRGRRNDDSTTEEDCDDSRKNSELQLNVPNDKRSVRNRSPFPDDIDQDTEHFDPSKEPMCTCHRNNPGSSSISSSQGNPAQVIYEKNPFRN